MQDYKNIVSKKKADRDNKKKEYELKRKTILGMLWNTAERFGTLGISFVSNLVLARFLTPFDYGCVGMLLIFIAIANTLIDGGLGAALIQKKEPSTSDYTTVFYFNITLSLFLYALLFFTAPAIASFYQIPILTQILRVQGVILLINAFRIIQYNILIKTLNFRKLAIVDLTTTTIGAVVGIIMAIYGWGVWSLVYNNLIYSFLFTVLLNILGRWIPKGRFDKRSFASLFSFGGLMLISNLLDTLYKNIQSLIIGKSFSVTSLGYYTQAKKMEECPVLGLSFAVNSVFFSVFSKLQDDKMRLQNIARKNVKALTFVSFPLMILLIIIAKPIFELIYTSKWNQSVPMFQILCVAGMIIPVNMSNLNIIRSLGKGKLYLLMQISQLGLGLLSILIGMHWGLYGLIIGAVIASYLVFFITASINAKLIGFKITDQIRNISGNYILSWLIGGITLLIVNQVHTNLILSIIYPTALYLMLFFGASFLFKMHGLVIYIDVIKEHIRS